MPKIVRLKTKKVNITAALQKHNNAADDFFSGSEDENHKILEKSIYQALETPQNLRPIVNTSRTGRKKVLDVIKDIKHTEDSI